jgi:hypothetical protein
MPIEAFLALCLTTIDSGNIVFLGSGRNTGPRHDKTSSGICINRVKQQTAAAHTQMSFYNNSGLRSIRHYDYLRHSLALPGIAQPDKLIY